MYAADMGYTVTSNDSPILEYIYNIREYFHEINNHDLYSYSKR